MINNILILEDEKEIAQLYAKRLNDKGYVTEIAHDGFEGLRKLKKFSPYLILLDVNMPKMGGLEFYQYICDSQQKPLYPVLVLTGRADLETLFKDFHVDGVLIKPFNSARLLTEVDIIFNKHYLKKTGGHRKTVIIVDDDPVPAKRIFNLFTDAGFKTDIVSGGIIGIETMLADPPDLALVKLGLADLSGDMVILRLQQIARTRRTKTLLYMPKNADLDKVIMQKISSKTGIKHMLEYNDPSDLLNAANDIFLELELDS